MPTRANTTLLAIAVWGACAVLSACGGDDADPASKAGKPSSMTGSPSLPGEAGNDSASDARTCESHANALSTGRPPYGCEYACLEGFADCDDSRTNGCETDLRAPGACAACGALACLSPSVCGLSEPVCGAKTLRMRQLSRKDGQRTELGGFAAASAGAHVLTLANITFSDATIPLALPGGVALRLAGPDNTVRQWLSKPDGDGYSASQLTRCADGLLFYGHNRGTVTVTRADWSGSQRWTVQLPGPAGLSARDAVCDGEGNVYLYLHTSDSVTIGDDAYEGPYPPWAGRFVVALSAAGALRWSTDPGREDPIGTVGEDWKDIAVIGSRVGILRNGDISYFSAATGAFADDWYSGQGYMTDAYGNAALATDAAGNFYIAATTTARATGSDIPMPSAVAAGASAFPQRTHVHITKFSPSHGRQWSRSLVWMDGKAPDEDSEGYRSGPSPNYLHLAAFHVTPEGQAWLVAAGTLEGKRRQFLAGVSEAGVVSHVHLLDIEQTVQFVDTDPEGMPVMAGTFRDWQYTPDLLLSGEGVFMESVSL